jgi:hypothetical protein
MSVANNHLDNLPIETLKLVSISLQYLSLANNDFGAQFYSHNITFREYWKAINLMLSQLSVSDLNLGQFHFRIMVQFPTHEQPQRT